MSAENTASVESTDSDVTAINRNIYLLPGELSPNEANLKARPAETTADRARRVADMVQSIKGAGQTTPVLVMEISDDGGTVHYEYVEGGSRVDAIAQINAAHALLAKPVAPIKVWCSVLPGDTDTFRTAVVSNIHRFGNSILELGAICKETAERNGFSGRGMVKKIAAYLGISEPRVVEYMRVNEKASPALRAKIISGEVTSLEVALKILDMPVEKQDVITARAAEIALATAVDKAAAKAAKANGGEMTVISETGVEVVEVPFLPDGTVVDAASGSTESASAVASVPGTTVGTTETPRITGSAVREAAAEVGETAGPLKKNDILDFFAEKIGPAYGDSVKAFCEYFCDTYAKGVGTERTANKLFDVMTAQSAETKAANKAKAKEAAEQAKAEAKAAAEKAKRRGPQRKTVAAAAK